MRQLIFLKIYSKTDCAIAKPSCVDVPLPNSSKITKDDSEALLIILEVSTISIMKVDIPFAKLSDAPIRVNILSKILKLAELAGTKHPIWFIKIIMAVCLKNVLLPAILGPVINHKLFLSSIEQLFGMKFNASFFKLSSTIGCLPSTISIIFIFSSSFGLI